MYDTNDLIKAIKQLGVDAFEATKPVSIVFGQVVSASPLQIKIDQKMTLSSQQLILSRNVTDFTIPVTIDWTSETKSQNADHKHNLSGKIEVDPGTVTNTLKIDETEIPLSHNHKIKGQKTMTIHNKLKVNDQVILFRMQGGQKYLVIDRIGG